MPAEPAPMDAHEPAVITGLGVVTAVGLELDGFFEALLGRRCGGAPVERFAQEGLRRSVAALVDRDAVYARLEDDERDLPWAAAMALAAARSALADAGLEGEIGETPLVVSNSIGAPGSVEAQGVSWAEVDLTDPDSFAKYAQGAIVAAVARRLGARGEVQCVSTTCAAGNYALAAGLDALRDGAPRVLVGGCEELSTMPYTAFHQIRAIDDVCRPFDADRQGLLFGEGAAFLVLEPRTTARARDARPYAELLGVGSSNDAHHLMAPHPQGAGAALALRRALHDSGVDVGEVGYVNAHGTGTSLNDAAEANALTDVFGDAVASLPVSSTKGATGHTMGAAGAVEAVVTTLAIERETLPPTTGLDEVDADLGLDDRGIFVIR